MENSILKIEVLGRLRVLRVKTCKLRVTCKTRNPHWKMYGFTRNLPSTWVKILLWKLSKYILNRRTVSKAVHEGGTIGRVLQILSGITQQQQNENVQKSALRAIQSWLHFDIGDDPNMLDIPNAARMSLKSFIFLSV